MTERENQGPPTPMRATLARALCSALAQLGIEPCPRPEEIRLEHPANPANGDWSSNVAMAWAKRTGSSPRDLAAKVAAIVDDAAVPHVQSIEIAGAGFLNFRLADSWLHDVLTTVVLGGEADYARSDEGQGRRVQLEFVSANPTGPLHVGNGWWCAYGDALGRVMSRCGWDVWREYYVNDTGGQVRRLGMSLLARHAGEEVPEEGYQGAYVAELARTYNGPTGDGPDAVIQAGSWAAERILANIADSLARLGIVFDSWFSQASIEESGAVAETIADLSAHGLVYEADGAVWLASTKGGDSRDRVLRKSESLGGDFTYLAGDLAYHRNKFLVRGFDRVIDIFGADHHGQVASLMAGVAALGIEAGRLEVKLGQMISLAEGKMSKRAGNFVSLDSLVADIGPDATRLLSLMTSIDQATTLDLELVRRQSMDNPVYYVQYAHARIASIERVRQEKGLERVSLAEAELALLVHPRELDLLRSLETLPSVVSLACAERAPHKVTTWVRDLAGRFHGFYHDCYVMGDDVPPALTQARLWLVEATRIGLAIGLDLLGVSAPETM